MTYSAGRCRRPRAAGAAVLLAAATLVACGGGAAAARRAAPIGPTTAPSLLPGVIKLADAKPLSDLVAGGLQATMTDKLALPQPAGDDRTVYFGEVDEYDGPDEDAKVVSALPIVATKDGDDWQAVPLVGRGLANVGWKYVGAGPTDREVWGVLDTAAGDGGPDVIVAHSTDGGGTLRLFALPKPCRQATTFDFLMTRDGHGRLTLSLDEAVGRNRPGLYHYETTDGGQTWSARPRFEPDGMIRADSVPDDEQPDLPAADHGKSRTAWPSHAHRRRAVATVRFPAPRAGR